jgi:hypothetical protein
MITLPSVGIQDEKKYNQGQPQERNPAKCLLPTKNNNPPIETHSYQWNNASMTYSVG